MAEGGTHSFHALGLGAAIAGAVLVVCFVSYRTTIGPRLEFDPRVDSFVFERDALSDDTPDQVPLDELFSPENVERYRDGDGFEAVFRVLHDPRAGGETSEVTCGLEPWARFAQTSNPERRALISERETEFRRCVSKFRRRSSVSRSLEIGIDDTEGVDSELADWVKRTLTDGNVSVERVFEMTRRDDVRLVFFRLSNIEAYDQRLYAIDTGTSREEIERAWRGGLDDWLLAERAPRQRTSIARGVFNALSRNGDMLRREIHLFSDGMENSEFTSFYEMIDTPFDQAELDREMRELIRCPDRVPPDFDLTWHFVPRELPFYYRVRDYWEHVLRDVCALPASTVLY